MSLLCEQPSSLEICRTNYQTYTSTATRILYLTQFNLNLNFGARPSFQSYSPQPPITMTRSKLKLKRYFLSFSTLALNFHHFLQHLHIFIWSLLVQPDSRSTEISSKPSPTFELVTRKPAGSVHPVKVSVFHVS